MDAHDIDLAVLSLSPPGVAVGDPPLADHLTRHINEATAATVATATGRFAGLVDQEAARFAANGSALSPASGGTYSEDQPEVAKADRGVEALYRRARTTSRAVRNPRATAW